MWLNMTKSEWEKIQRNYNEYLRRYPEEGNVTVTKTNFDYPLQSYAHLQKGGFAGPNRSELERELLITFDKSLPNIEELSIETLTKLPIELMNILKVQLSPDHREYWKLTYLILEDTNEQDSLFPSGLVNDLETLFRLSSCVPIPSHVHEGGPHPEQAAWDRKGHESHTIYRAKHIAAYLSFPLLEGLIKSVCSDYIEMDGSIKQGQKIKQYYGGYNDGNYCNRLRDLLTHLEEEYADLQLRSNLKDLRNYVGDFYDCNPNKVYKLIDNWRNTSLHGENAPDAEYGTILNLICLIIWSEFKLIS